MLDNAIRLSVSAATSYLAAVRTNPSRSRAIIPSLRTLPMVMDSGVLSGS